MYLKIQVNIGCEFAKDINFVFEKNLMLKNFDYIF